MNQCFLFLAGIVNLWIKEGCSLMRLMKALELKT